MYTMLSVVVICVLASCGQAALFQDKFPDNFEFGVSTAAFPTEGAWDWDGKDTSC